MQRVRLKKKMVFSLVAWTLFIVLVFLLNLHQVYKSKFDLAKDSVYISYANDVVYRRWAAEHGGVYVPLNDANPPNPYLNVKDKVLTCDNGKTYTLLNPAYMTRQVHKKKREDYNLYSKVTSLNLINPVNAPDEWERKQLTFLEGKDMDEGVFELTEMDGQDFMRYMRPFRIEKDCLNCHMAQGYKLGDIRGAISVSIPMGPYWKSLSSETLKSIAIFFLIWSSGVTFILYNYRSIRTEINKNLDLATAVTRYNAKYRSVFEEASEGILIHDLSGKILEANPYFQNLSGYTLEELRLLAPEQLVPPEERPRFFSEMNAVGRGECMLIEHMLACKNGELLPVEVATSRIDDRYIQGLVRDISLRKENDQLKEDIERIFRHDIKSPLNTIIGMPQIMEDDDNLSTEQKEQLAIIKKAGYRILDQIDMSFNLHKVETGTYEYMPARFNVLRVIGEILSGLTALINEKCIRIEGNYLQHENDHFFADEFLCYSIFSNAIKNAVEASPFNGFVRIDIEITQTSSVVTIRNEGPVPSRLIDTFFDKYSTYGKKQGTGLGTYIIKKFTEAQGGEVFLSSHQDAGTTLTVSIPNST